MKFLQEWKVFFLLLGFGAYYFTQCWGTSLVAGQYNFRAHPDFIITGRNWECLKSTGWKDDDECYLYGDKDIREKAKREAANWAGKI